MRSPAGEAGAWTREKAGWSAQTYPFLGLERCEKHISRAETTPSESVTAVPQTCHQPCNTPVPTAAGAWGWRRCSPKDSALDPGSQHQGPLQARSLLIPDGRKACSAHTGCCVCEWEQICTSWHPPLLLPQRLIPISWGPQKGLHRKCFAWKGYAAPRASLKLLCTELEGKANPFCSLGSC